MIFFEYPQQQLEKLCLFFKNKKETQKSNRRK